MIMDKVNDKARGAKSNQSAGKKGTAVNDKKKSLPRKHVISNRAIKRSVKDPICHYVKVGVTQEQYNELRAQAKEKRMPVSKMMRVMAFGSEAGSGAHNGAGMKRLDKLYADKNKELAYLVKHANIVYYINKIAVNINQCMRFLNTYGDSSKYSPMWVKKIADCSEKINEVLEDKVIKQVKRKPAKQND